MTVDNKSQQELQDTTAGLPAKGTSSFSLLIEFLGSMRLAIMLLVIIAVSAVIGTVLQQNKSYSDYISEFGSFWFEVFNALGLFDVYYSWWFIIILGFLVLSVSVCVVRYAPIMIREMREDRLTVKLLSLRAFKNNKEWQSNHSESETAAKAEEYLQSQGFKVKTKKQDGHTVVAAKQGHWNRLGYIFTHVAILLICLGGLIDGNIGLKFKELTGQVTIGKFNEPVNAKSILEISDSMSFRGKMDLAEGDSKENTFAIIQYRDGLLFQKLPFSVRLKEFKVFYYSTGMPKTFQSEIIVKDNDSGKEFSRKISVNHPLRHRGYAIYQSTFGDGGSLLKLNLTPMLSLKEKVIEKDIKIFRSYTLDVPAALAPNRIANKKQLEITGFKPINVIPAEKSKIEMPGKAVLQEHSTDVRVVRDKKFRNIGSSLTFKIRSANGQAQEYVNYGLPRVKDGVTYLISDMRPKLNLPIKRYFFPLDKNNSPKRYLMFRQMVLDRSQVKKLIQQYISQSGIGRQTQQPGNNKATNIQMKIAESINKMFYAFVRGGQDAVTQEMRKTFPTNLSPEKQKIAETQFTKTRTFFLSSIAGILRAVYYDALALEGYNNSDELTEFDKKFFVFSTQALLRSEDYPSPYFVQFTLKKHIESSGLQITRAPGTWFVYSGSGLLVIGIYMMFYVLLKRVWVYVYPANDNNGMNVVYAATCNRPDDSVAEYFTVLGEMCAKSIVDDKQQI